jgi:hypothetical protein
MSSFLLEIFSLVWIDFIQVRIQCQNSGQFTLFFPSNTLLFLRVIICLRNLKVQKNILLHALILLARQGRCHPA